MKKFLLSFFLTVALFTMGWGSGLKLIALENLEYDDNIYLTQSSKEGSFISSTKAGLNYEAKVPNSALKGFFNALGGYNAYSKNNGRNGYWDANAELKISSDLFTFGDDFLLTSDPANAELTQRAKRIANTLYADIRTSPNRTFGLGFKVADIYEHYQESYWAYLNRNRLDASALGYLNLSPDTNIFIEYQHTQINYQDNENNNSTGGAFAVGINGDISSKVRCNAQVSYNFRNYENSFPNADNYNDMFGYLLALSWEPSTQNILRLSGQRRMEETFYGANRFFTSSNISLYFSQKIKNKIKASVTVSYENISYKKEFLEVTRRDNILSLRPEVSYLFKSWLEVGIWYQFKERNSNALAQSYDNNRAGLFAKCVF